MGRVVLKERVFSPTGNSLGSFSAIDLVPFDLQYTESDEPQTESGSDDSPKPRVPEPNDPDKLKPIGGSVESNKSSPPNYGSGDGNNDQNQGQQNRDRSFDRGDYDIDQDEGPTQDQMNKAQQGGASAGGDDSGDDDSGGGGASSDSTPRDMPGQSGNNQSGDNGQQGGQDSQGGQQPGSQAGGQSQSSQGGQGSQGQNSQGQGQDGSSTGQGSADGTSSDSQGQGNNSQSGNQNTGDKSFDSWGDDEEGDGDVGVGEADDGDGESEMGKIIQKDTSNRTKTAKQREEIDDSVEEERGDNSSDSGRPNGTSKVDPAEIKSVKDAINDALKAAREDKDSANSGTISDAENDLLDAMGAGKLSAMVHPRMKSDWRSTLDKIFDMALGSEVFINPNLMNKKIEDAPPGSEDDMNRIERIAVLMDCSGSMGASQFKQALEHVDTMLKARRLGHVKFHIYGFGDTDMREILSTGKIVKGSAFLKTMKANFQEKNWGTYLTPAMCVLSQKVKHPDAIFIFTDAEIFDAEIFKRTKEAVAYVKKFKKRIIWVLTSNAQPQKIKDFDPYAFQNKLYVKFKKS